MFQTKICGITSVEDALAVARAGADAIGLNFYSRSPRHVAEAVASEIVVALPAGIVKVGLFVDTPARDVCRLFDHLQLDLIQLHGDQPPEFLAQVGDRPVMPAFRVGPDGLRPVIAYLALPRAGQTAGNGAARCAGRGRVWRDGTNRRLERGPSLCGASATCPRSCLRADSRRKTSPRRFGRSAPRPSTWPAGSSLAPAAKIPSWSRHSSKPLGRRFVPRDAGVGCRPGFRQRQEALRADSD